MNDIVDFIDFQFIMIYNEKIKPIYYREEMSMKKKIVKITTLFLTLAMSLTCLPVTSSLQEVQAATNWRKAYKNFMRKELNKDNRSNYGFRLEYINSDSIPEMIVTSGNHAEGVMLVTAKGAQYDVISADEIFFSAKKNMVMCSNCSMGYGGDCFYKVKNGKWLFVDGGTYQQATDLKYAWCKDEYKISNETKLFAGDMPSDNKALKKITGSTYDKNIASYKNKYGLETSYSYSEICGSFYDDMLLDFTVSATPSTLKNANCTALYSNTKSTSVDRGAVVTSIKLTSSTVKISGIYSTKVNGLEKRYNGKTFKLASNVKYTVSGEEGIHTGKSAFTAVLKHKEMSCGFYFKLNSKGEVSELEFYF